jgi:hypothetical protein
MYKTATTVTHEMISPLRDHSMNIVHKTTAIILTRLLLIIKLAVTISSNDYFGVHEILLFIL